VNQTKCFNNGTPEPFEDVPVNFTVGFFGDQGLGNNSVAVLTLCRDEGVQMIIHGGDFDYRNDPTGWEDQITSVLGPNFPYFVSIGNHDVPSWDSSQTEEATYQEVIHGRMSRIQGVKCQGEIGVNLLCTYRGITFLLSGIGTLGFDHEDITDYSFSTFPGRWRICSWHKNQRLMQIGNFHDETGWLTYEMCRKHGAMVVTGHEHHYARTFLLSSFQQQTIVSNDTQAPLLLKEGQSFLVVSGVGGKSIFHWNNTLREDPWWAAAHARNDGLNFGALICKFNYNGQKDRAFCYFKQIDSVVLDSFLVISQVNTTAKETTLLSTYDIEEDTNEVGFDVDDPTVRVTQVDSSCDDASSSTNGTVDGTSAVLELRSNNTVGFRFNSVDLGADELPLFRRAFLQFRVAANSTGSYRFNITVEDTIVPEPFCSNNGSTGFLPLSSLPRRNISVIWEGSDPWTVGQNVVSPNVRSMVTQMVETPGWRAANSMTFLIESELGSRSVGSYDGSHCLAPFLVLETRIRPRPS
jgi:hypothetical protein